MSLSSMPPDDGNVVSTHRVDFLANRVAHALHVACQLATKGEVKAPLALQEGHSASSMTDGEWLLKRLPGLFRPPLLPMCQRMAALIDSRGQWWHRARNIGLACLVGIGLVAAIVSYARNGAFTHWKTSVDAQLQEAVALRDHLAMLSQSAASIGAFPHGAALHARAAIAQLQMASGQLIQLEVAAPDPDALHNTYVKNKSADDVLAHDRPLLDRALSESHKAELEIALAQDVERYSQKWDDLAVPVELPAALGSAWVENAQSMKAGIEQGNVQVIEQADQRLTELSANSAMDAQARSLVARFADDARPTAAAMVAGLDVALANGDVAKAKGDLDRLQVFSSQAPLVYGLQLVAQPGVHSGVERAQSGNSGPTRDYLIVEAVDVNGAPVDIPIYDSEARQQAIAYRFGVEVTPAVFAAVRDRRNAGETAITIAHKDASSALPVFNVPVLDGRITTW